MVHLAALPGSPSGGDLTPVLAAALTDAEALAAGGVDGMIVENFGDVPFTGGRVPPATVASMAVVCREIRRAHNVPLGVNVLRNDAAAALSVAAVTGADFIRVNVHVGAVVADQGVIEGRARETLALRESLAPPVLIFADVAVKHSRPLGMPGPGHIANEARDAFHRGRADALIVSGEATGSAADASSVAALREAVPDAPILLGSGVTAENLEEYWSVADGVIVGSSLEKGGVGGAPVEEARVRAFMEEAARLRRESGASPGGGA
jgi:hypothetical protein